LNVVSGSEKNMVCCEKTETLRKREMTNKL